MDQDSYEYRKAQATQLHEARAAQAIGSIVAMLNQSDTPGLIVAEFAKQHRTHQQAFVREIIQPILEHLSNLKEGEYDLRNEDSIRYAVKAVNANDGVYLPLI